MTSADLMIQAEGLGKRVSARMPRSRSKAARATGVRPVAASARLSCPELPGELLAQGFRASEVLELGDDVGGLADGEVGVDPPGQGLEAFLVEAGDEGHGVLGVLGVGEGRARQRSSASVSSRRAVVASPAVSRWRPCLRAGGTGWRRRRQRRW